MSSAVETTTLQNTNRQSCIDACMRCAEACEFCATSDLKEEQDIKMMASCAQMNRQCAAVCWTSAALMSMDSQFAKQFCNLCEDICDVCAQECERHDVDHCKKFAPKHVAAALKNVERWLDNNNNNRAPYFLMFLELILLV
jgi:hypothetical protein